jgi:hypothetical protein
MFSLTIALAAKGLGYARAPSPPLLVTRVVMRALPFTQLGDDVDLEAIAKRTPGFVGADIASLCREASMQCIREKMDVIDIEGETIDTGVLDSMAVTMDQFMCALALPPPPPTAYRLTVRVRPARCL